MRLVARDARLISYSCGGVQETHAATGRDAPQVEKRRAHVLHTIAVILSQLYAQQAAREQHCVGSPSLVVAHDLIAYGHSRGAGLIVEALPIAPAELSEHMARHRRMAPQLAQPAVVALTYACTEWLYRL